MDDFSKRKGKANEAFRRDGRLTPATRLVALEWNAKWGKTNADGPIFRTMNEICEVLEFDERTVRRAHKQLKEFRIFTFQLTNILTRTGFLIYAWHEFMTGPAAWAGSGNFVGGSDNLSGGSDNFAGGSDNLSGQYNREKEEKRESALLPENWCPSEETFQFGLTLGFDKTKIALAAERFRNRHRSKGDLSCDWNSEFRNWLLGDAEGERTRHGAGHIARASGGLRQRSAG